MILFCLYVVNYSRKVMTWKRLYDFVISKYGTYPICIVIVFWNMDYRCKMYTTKKGHRSVLLHFLVRKVYAACNKSPANAASGSAKIILGPPAVLKPAFDAPADFPLVPRSINNSFAPQNPKTPKNGNYY